MLSKSFGLRGVLGTVATAYSLGKLAGDRIWSERKELPTWSAPAASVKEPSSRVMRIVPVKRRRTTRMRMRKRSRSWVPRPFSNGYIVIKRSAIGAAGFSLTPSVGFGPSLKCQFFQLNYLPNVTDFTSLYQQYRIRRIDLKFVLRSDPGNPNATGTTALATAVPQLLLSNDNAKTTDPSSVNDVLCYQNCRICFMDSGKPVYHTVWPKSINTVQGSNIAPVTEWLFTSSAAVPHYGVQVAWVGSNNTMSVDVYATYTVEFKGRA